MKLKIWNVNRGAYPVLFGDWTGKQHVFEWDETLQAYALEPEDQKQSDDICETNWRILNMPYRVAPVWDTVATPERKLPGVKTPEKTYKIPPFVKPELYSQYPVQDLLALCSDAGFQPEGDTTSAGNLRSQLASYYVGRSWAAEEIKRLKAELLALKPVLEPVKVITLVDSQKPAESVTTSKNSVIVPPLKKRGRPRKVQELQPV